MRGIRGAITVGEDNEEEIWQGAKILLSQIMRRNSIKTEDIGARRLHTTIERVLEDISFECESYAGKKVVITAQMVRDKLGELVENVDLARYIL